MTSPHVFNGFVLSNESDNVAKSVANLICLDTNKSARRGEIWGTSLKEVAGILPLPLKNVIIFLVYLASFLEMCKVAKLKPLCKKSTRNYTTKTQTYSTFGTSILNNWKINTPSYYEIPSFQNTTFTRHLSGPVFRLCLHWYGEKVHANMKAFNIQTLKFFLKEKISWFPKICN